MVRHALRAIPWWLLAGAAALVTVLLRIVEQWPYAMWPLAGLAVGLLAGAATWAFDEPAADVVDTLPRGLAWRTAARCLGLACLLAWWSASVYWTRAAYFEHAADVAWQGVSAVLASTAVATVLRGRGVAAPARSLSSGIVAATAYVALARPLEDRVPLLPYTAVGPWDESRVWWAALAGAAALALLLELTETPALRR